MWPLELLGSVELNASAEVSSIHQAMESAKSHIKAFGFHFWSKWWIQESGAVGSHPMSYKLGCYSKWNHARDFWHFSRIDVVPRTVW